MSLFGRDEPTVPLSFHDALIASMRADLADQQKRYDALLEKFMALRVAGAVPEAPRLIAPCPPDCAEKAPHVHAPGLAAFREPDEMLSLIDAKAGGNLRMRGMMLRQLAADRANGVSDEDIRAGILNGVPGNGVPS